MKNKMPDPQAWRLLQARVELLELLVAQLIAPHLGHASGDLRNIRTLAERLDDLARVMPANPSVDPAEPDDPGPFEDYLDAAQRVLAIARRQPHQPRPTVRPAAGPESD